MAYSDTKRRDFYKFQSSRVSEMPNMQHNTYNNQSSPTKAEMWSTMKSVNECPIVFEPIRLCEMPEFTDSRSNSNKKSASKKGNEELNFQPVRLCEMPGFQEYIDDTCKSSTKKSNSKKGNEGSLNFQPVRFCEMPIFREIADDLNQYSTKKSASKKGNDGISFKPVRFCEMPIFQELADSNNLVPLKNNSNVKKQKSVLSKVNSKRLSKLSEVNEHIEGEYLKKKPQRQSIIVNKNITNKENFSSLNFGRVHGRINMPDVRVQSTTPVFQKKNTILTKSRYTVNSRIPSTQKIRHSQNDISRNKPTVQTNVGVRKIIISPKNKTEEILTAVIEKLNTFENNMANFKKDVYNLHVKMDQNYQDISTAISRIDNSIDSILINKKDNAVELCRKDSKENKLLPINLFADKCNCVCGSSNLEAIKKDKESDLMTDIRMIPDENKSDVSETCQQRNDENKNINFDVLHSGLDLLSKVLEISSEKKNSSDNSRKTIIKDFTEEKLTSLINVFNSLKSELQETLEEKLTNKKYETNIENKFVTKENTTQNKIAQDESKVNHSDSNNTLNSVEIIEQNKNNDSITELDVSSDIELLKFVTELSELISMKSDGKINRVTPISDEVLINSIEARSDKSAMEPDVELNRSLMKSQGTSMHSLDTTSDIKLPSKKENDSTSISKTIASACSFMNTVQNIKLSLSEEIKEIETEENVSIHKEPIEEPIVKQPHEIQNQELSEKTIETDLLTNEANADLFLKYSEGSTLFTHNYNEKNETDLLTEFEDDVTNIKSMISNDMNTNVFLKYLEESSPSTPNSNDSPSLEIQTPLRNFNNINLKWLTGNSDNEQDDAKLNKTVKSMTTIKNTDTTVADHTFSSPDILSKTLKSYNTLNKDSVLCTPKMASNIANIMTPGAKLNKKIFLSRMIQSQLQILNED